MDDSYRVKPEPWWLACQLGKLDDFATIEVARRQGWRPVPIWGGLGWDLGRWPRQVLYHRQQGDAFELATSVDGNIECWSFPSPELRDAGTDELAYDWWKAEHEVWLERVRTFVEMPDDLRGPYELPGKGTAVLVVVRGGAAEVITEGADVVIWDWDQWYFEPAAYRQRCEASLDRLRPADRQWLEGQLVLDQQQLE